MKTTPLLSLLLLLATITAEAAGTNSFARPLVVPTKTNSAAAPAAFPSLPAPPSGRPNFNRPGAQGPGTATNPGGSTGVTGTNGPLIGYVTNAPVVTNAQGNVVESADIFFNIDNMPLAQVLDEYATLVNRTILRSSQLPITTFITLKTQNNLTKSEAISALETVMAMNGIAVIPIGEKFMKVVTHAEAAGGGAVLANPEDVAKLPESGKFVTEVVQLHYIPLQDATTAITPFASGKINPSIVPIPNSQTLVLRDFSENIKRMLEIIAKIDVISQSDVKPEIIPIKYALASDIQQVLGSLTASGPGLTVGHNSSKGLSGTVSGPGGVSSGGYYPPGTTPPGGTTTGLSSGMSSTGTSGRSAFGSRLQGILNRATAGAAGGGADQFQILGQAKIIADERTNSLLIFANDQDMKMIKEIIAKLDVVLAQVLIEAIVMEVSLDDTRNVGVSYLQHPKSFGNGVLGAGGVNNGTPFISPSAGSFISSVTGTNGSTSVSPVGITNLPSGFSYFTSIGSSFDVALQAAASDSRVNVLSRPRIQTSHAVEAQLFIGDTVPYVTGTYFGGINGQASSQYQEKEVGITLNVLPLINPDGLVVMDISQDIEQLGTPVPIDGNSVPTTTKRSAAAKVAVRDRETIVLGGFISTSKTKSRSGVPYLMNVPYIGALFRSKQDETKRTELMVFLRPTVLPTPEAAAIEANHERDALPGVKQTEFEIRQEEQKRRAVIEQELREQMGVKSDKAIQDSEDKTLKNNNP